MCTRYKIAAETTGMDKYRISKMYVNNFYRRETAFYIHYTET